MRSIIVSIFGAKRQANSCVVQSGSAGGAGNTTREAIVIARCVGWEVGRRFIA